MADEESEQGEPDEVESPTEELQHRDLTISDAYAIGANVVYLQIAGKENYSVGSPSQGHILGSLEVLQNRLIETRTALRVAEEIQHFKAQILDYYQEENLSTPIDDVLGNELYQSAKTWNSLLEETLANETRINIPNTGILDWELLMRSPDGIFGSHVWESMDEAPRKDMQEACRSLPIGCPTASVMVSLRAVEHYLRKWHRNAVGEEIGRGTWGSVLDELIDEYVEEHDRKGSVLQQLSGVPSVLSNLYYLKEKRDKVNHPEEAPTTYEAAITLFMVAGTITEICEKLDETEAGDV